VAAFYIHIPFCRQACIYCNFHFSTVLKNKEAVLDAINKEILERTNYAGAEPIETIYFGGGTPSLLSAIEIEKILQAIYRNYPVQTGDIEITLEGNPDDLNKNKISELKSAGINRLSIGIQSFSDNDLKLLNRVHLASQAHTCIEEAQNAGIGNITIDLIYGIPGQDDQTWNKNLDILKSKGLPHFSAYALTVEPKTALDHLVAKKKIAAVNEDQTARHFNMLQQWSTENGYLPYEISNYCLPGKFSRHNTSYWQAKKYIGVGPSAHSFDGTSRQWNIANNSVYIKNVNENLPYFEREELTAEQQYNEYVMTSLRTMWGCSKDRILNDFGEKYLMDFESNASQYIKDNLLLIKDNTVYLTLAGKLLADKISSDLFVVT
jgi:oxygen-independent coproporphyrinogen III oxidase